MRAMLARVAALAVLALWASSGAAQAALSLEEVDDYVLALTWHPGFCAGAGQGRDECRDGDGGPLVLHGLWPGLPASLARDGVGRGEWNREGCFRFAPERSGPFCSIEPLILDRALEAELERVMPGERSCLDRYQFAKHASCFDISPERYFTQAVSLFEEVERSRFAAWLFDHRGEAVGRNALIQAFRDAFGADGRALMLVCDRADNLTELRIGLDARRIDEFPASASFSRLGTGRCGGRITLR